MGIPGNYELKNKLNRQTKKHKLEILELRILIKKQNEIIDALKERIRFLKTREMYQTWLKEREEVIKQLKEKNVLTDEIINLKTKLIDEINLSTKKIQELEKLKKIKGEKNDKC